MKPLKRIPIALLSLLALPIFNAGCRPDFAKWTVPADWYLLPENGGPEPGEKLTPAGKALEEATHQLLLSNIGSLVRTDQIPIHPHPHPHPWPPVPPDFLPWHLGAFVTNLSLSAGGILGNLVMNGAPGVQLIWEKEASGLSSGELRALTQGNVPIRISGKTHPADLKKQIEAAIKSGMATGIILDETTLRRTLLESAEKLQAFGSVLDTLPSGKPWQVSNFTLGVVVNASGNVTPTQSAGATVTFQLEWGTRSARRNGLPDGLPSRLKEALTEFVQTVSEDFQDLSQEAHSIADTGFNLSGFQLGVAFTADGDVGLAQGSAQLFGNLAFQHADGLQTARPEIKGYFPIIAPASNQKLLDYAEKEKIPHELRRARAGGESDTVVYQVDREKVRKGLRRSVHLAEFFARRAQEAKLNSWKIDELDLNLDISLAGTLGLTPVSVDGTIQLNFENAYFHRRQ